MSQACRIRALEVPEAYLVLQLSACPCDFLKVYPHNRSTCPTSFKKHALGALMVWRVAAWCSVCWKQDEKACPSKLPSWPHSHKDQHGGCLGWIPGWLQSLWADDSLDFIPCLSLSLVSLHSCLWEQFLNWLTINRVCSRIFLEHHKTLKQAVFRRVP